MAKTEKPSFTAVVIGAGPAGLMAAEVLSADGVAVSVYDAMPSAGRKFLLAGRGGLNLTHAGPFEEFLAHYGTRAARLRPSLEAFGPEALCAWAHALGINTFTGSSGRVFPDGMKAAPLLRAWLQRLRRNGVQFHMRHRWRGWDDNNNLFFATPQGEQALSADAVVLALGGGSWPQLGSDGAWAPLLMARDIAISELRPANCGFEIRWSNHFIERYSGQPVKTVAVTFTTAAGDRITRQGEFMITAYGVEGELIYALSAPLRDGIAAHGRAVIHMDLAPGRSQQQLANALSQPRGKNSFSSHLRKRAGLHGVKTGLLREMIGHETVRDPVRLAAVLKALPLTLNAPRPLAEAISTAGGVAFESLDEHLMIKKLPGVFCAGEMLDWEAPTGGYLLTACFATGRAAGIGALKWLQKSGSDSN